MFSVKYKEVREDCKGSMSDKPLAFRIGCPEFPASLGRFRLFKQKTLVRIALLGGLGRLPNGAKRYPAT